MWQHLETGDVLFTEEPYPSRLQQHGEDREIWAQRHGYDIADSDWGSVYSNFIEMVMISPTYAQIGVTEIQTHLKKAEKPLSI